MLSIDEYQEAVSKWIAQDPHAETMDNRIVAGQCYIRFLEADKNHILSSMKGPMINALGAYLSFVADVCVQLEIPLIEIFEYNMEVMRNGSGRFSK